MLAHTQYRARLRFQAKLGMLSDTLAATKQTADTGAEQIKGLTTALTAVETQVNAIADNGVTLPTCKHVKSPGGGRLVDNGDHHEDGVPLGVMLSFACADGKWRKGPATMTCKVQTKDAATGAAQVGWSSGSPTCEDCGKGCALCTTGAACKVCTTGLMLQKVRRRSRPSET